MKKVISSILAPAAIGPYSQAIESNGFVFTSGQIPLDPGTGEIVGTTIEEQAERVMQNLKAVLAQAGVGFDHVVKTTCFLADLADFAAFNAVYGKYFPENAPARSCFQVAGLPKGAKLEVEVIAAK
ncbi:MAG: RidA family protein [Butyricicoccus sp.]